MSLAGKSFVIALGTLEKVVFIPDTSGLNSEAASSFSFVRTLMGLTGYRKVFNRTSFLYEDWGAVTASITLITPKQTIGPVSKTFGGNNDGKTRRVFFDHEVIDAEMFNLQIDRAAGAGALSIVQIDFWLRQGGDAFEST